MLRVWWAGSATLFAWCLHGHDWVEAGFVAIFGLFMCMIVTEVARENRNVL